MRNSIKRLLLASATALALSGCNLEVNIIDDQGNPDIGGSVTSTDGNLDCPEVSCSFKYPYVIREVTLNAVAEEGYEFKGFSSAELICTNGLEDSLETASCVTYPLLSMRITATFGPETIDICPDDDEDNCLANPEGDFDNDGVKNSEDVCPENNPDSCPAGDLDGDGVINGEDICPLASDDSCDEGDVDGDGILNGADVCMLDPTNNCLENAEGDFDGDGIKNGDDLCPTDNPDTCPEGDLDNDGVANSEDICPENAEDLCPAGDTDSDGITDSEDLCLDDATNQCLNNPEGDLDGDGVNNAEDVCPEDNPDTCPAGDLDGDGANNEEDPCPTDAANACPAGDIDNDGVDNGTDICPMDPNDNCIENPEGDLDGDGVANGDDPCPANNPDSCPAGDLDGDTVLNETDNCPEVANEDQANFDGDSLGDVCDDDDDNDTSLDVEDCEPFNANIFPGATEALDGIDNNCNGLVDDGAVPPAPTGLAKVNSGWHFLGDTWGDFVWNEVPFADSYELHMDSRVGCIAYDHSQHFAAPIDAVEGNPMEGRAQSFWLCLGTQYKVTIRAAKDGIWGPWSEVLFIHL